jgi:hypothetical protein
MQGENEGRAVVSAFLLHGELGKKAVHQRAITTTCNWYRDEDQLLYAALQALSETVVALGVKAGMDPLPF